MSNPKVYAFQGDVIRLTLKDFNEIHERHCYWMNSTQFMEKLNSLDSWMRGKKIKSWYFVLISLLGRERGDYEYKKSKEMLEE